MEEQRVTQGEFKTRSILWAPPREKAHAVSKQSLYTSRFHGVLPAPLDLQWQQVLCRKCSPGAGETAQLVMCWASRRTCVQIPGTHIKSYKPRHCGDSRICGAWWIAPLMASSRVNERPISVNRERWRGTPAADRRPLHATASAHTPAHKQVCAYNTYTYIRERVCSPKHLVIALFMCWFLTFIYSLYI